MPVHPRACGELQGKLMRYGGLAGSSPRVRGTHMDDLFQSAGRRFIPARAGNCAVVFPRVGRFIPARAGNSIAPPSDRVLLHRQTGGRDGSSPRVRGTLIHRCAHRFWKRFIPARAGNSSTRRSTPPPPSVHPRACGELTRGNNLRFWNGGSSPRVRGTLTRCCIVPPAIRFIPARAGNSPSNALLFALRPVHPRACGELARVVLVAQECFGSSPRVRGTLFLQGPDNKGFFRCQRAHQLILICSWVVCEMAQTGKS